MLIYRDDVERVLTLDFIARCSAAARAAPDADARVGLLVDVGMLEAALADAVMPEADDEPARIADLRQATLAAAHLVCGSGSAGALAAALARLERSGWPAAVDLRTPEGFAYYALDPASYAAAARRFAAVHRAGITVCIGLRSIGTSLAAMVAATLEAEGRGVESLTLRPRGHPFERRPVATAALGRWLAARAGAMFLVVDEGPGRSGSSFCGTAAFLEELGVSPARIAFFPSHRPASAAFVSAAARRRWPRHGLWHEPALDPCPPGGRDLSGGAWRPLLYGEGEPWPAVLPWQERRKFLDPQGRMHRFAGLGRFGRRALVRAQALAAAGLTPGPMTLRAGFLGQAFATGRPLRRNEADGPFLRWAAGYLGHLGCQATTGAAARPAALLPMVATNIREALSQDVAAGLARAAAGLPPAPAVAVDGRVQAHEWLRTSQGFTKTDALDHHADHGFPGKADIAWDVAGVGVEFDLTPAMRGDFAAVAAEALRDPYLPARLTFYEVAYLAHRVGQCASAAASLARQPDGLRMRRALRRYLGLLAIALARLEAA